MFKISLENVPIICVRKDGHGLVLQMLRDFRLKEEHFEVFCVFSHGIYIFSLTGNLLSTTVQHRPTAKQKHYGTTVPLQLVGQDWKPISQLKPEVKWK